IIVIYNLSITELVVVLVGAQYFPIQT
ncbi:MAG: hypothetical protein FD130_432, partial [Halothiobacillaceae bacterium]